MSLLKKIIFLLLSMLSFSCQTQLEKQGWQRTIVASQLDTSTVNKKDKELIVVKVPDKDFPHSDSTGKPINKPLLVQDKSFVYLFNVFFRDSVGNIRCEPFQVVTHGLFNSDLAYYKWESDSVCLVKILNHGNLQASYELSYSQKPFSRGLRQTYEK